MPYESLLLGVIFIASMSLTPGPANLSMLSVGSSHGFARAFPYLGGIWIGGFVVITAGALGLGALLSVTPWIYFTLKLAGLIYICWLAVVLVRSGFGIGAVPVAPSFWAGLLVHPLNPKAYVQNVVVFSSFIVPDAPYLPQALILAAVSVGLSMVAPSLWGLGGGVIRTFVGNARIMRWFAGAAAASMVLSVAAAFVV